MSDEIVDISYEIFKDKDFLNFNSISGKFQTLDLQNLNTSVLDIGISGKYAGQYSVSENWVLLKNKIGKLNNGRLVSMFDLHIGRKTGLLELPNSLLIFDETGIHHYEKNGNFKKQLFKKEFFTVPTILDHNIFTSGNEGIYKIEYLDDSISTFPKIIKHDGIVNQFIKYDKTIYIASENGIKEVDLEAETVIPKYLPRVYLQSLAKSKDGSLWAAAQNGLYHIKPDGTTRFYDESSGLPSQNFVKNCVTTTSDGRLWFGTDKGVVYFHPDSITEEPFDPPLYLNSLKIHGHEWADDTINIMVTASVELAHNENTLSLDWVAVNYDPLIKPQYKIYMKGYDTDTIEMEDQHTITYPNLQPGKYTFCYSACTQTGICSPQYAEFDITIHPPWWETWWFRTLVGLGLAGIGFWWHQVVYTQSA